MSIDATFELIGWQELNAALTALPHRLARKVLRSAVAKGAATVRKEMKAAAPVRKEGGEKRITAGNVRKQYKVAGGKSATRHPGFLKRNIRYKYSRKRSRYHDVHYVVGPFGPAFYGYILAHGHMIGSKKSAKRKKVRGSGTKYVPPKDFITPGL